MNTWIESNNNNKSGSVNNENKYNNKHRMNEAVLGGVVRIPKIVIADRDCLGRIWLDSGVVCEIFLCYNCRSAAK
jgi:hypothetical protein